MKLLVTTISNATPVNVILERIFTIEPKSIDDQAPGAVIHFKMNSMTRSN